MNFDQFTAPAKKARYEKLPRLLDGKYFEITKREGTKIEAVCTACKKLRKGNLTSTGNFMDHLRKSHPELVTEAESYKKSGVKNVINDKTQKTIQDMLKKFTHEEV